MHIPMKSKIIVNGHFYESVVDDSHKQQIMSIIYDIIDKINSVSGEESNQYLAQKKKDLQNDLKKAYNIVTREFPEIDLGDVSQHIPE